jgi:hypothetical protein
MDGCILQGTDPKPYLAEVIRIMPYWPPSGTRARPCLLAGDRRRLDSAELAAELGHITLPPAAARAPEQSAAS